MKRCTKKYTQNGNESIHSKLWRIVIKFKSHSTERYQFACQMVMMFHNFGHVKASLLNVLDCMTESSALFLKKDFFSEMFTIGQSILFVQNVVTWENHMPSPIHIHHSATAL